MSTHRRLITTAALLVLVACSAVPACAWGGSLLSGYGGPGQGNQAILGAALVNGPRGGGGGGGNGSAISAASALSSSPAGRSVASHKPSAPGAKQSAGSGPGQGPGAGGSTGSAGAESLKFRSLGSETAGSPALGISKTDLLYILLGIGGLALTGTLTRQLARRPR